QWLMTPVFKGTAQIGWVVLSYDWQEELSSLLGRVRKELMSLGNPVIEVVLVDEKGKAVVDSFPFHEKFIPSPGWVWKEKRLSFGKTAMRLIISNDRIKINEPITRMRNFFLGVTAIATIFLLSILCFILDRTFLSKLKAIQEGTNTFKSGNLAYRLPSMGHDELGLLASTFNEMGQSLQNASQELELRVEKRTAELKSANEKLSLEIAGHKQTSEALRESEEKYRVIFSKERDCIALIDPDSLEILDVNEAAETLWGYSREELLGMNALDLAVEPESSRESIYSLASVEGWAKVSREHQRKDGAIIHVEIFAAPVKLKGKTVICEIVRDVSDRLRAEQEKQELQAQLIQSQKMEALGTLVGGIAHDFNNILQVIIGYCDLLLTRVDLGKSAQKNLQTVIDTAKGGADLVKKLLLFGKEAPTRRVCLNLNDQIRQLANLISRPLLKVVELEMDLSDESPMIQADPSQMDQVVMNLVINASEAMPDGGQLKIATKIVRLDDEYCRSHHGLKPGAYVSLYVADNGRGMDERTISRIFEPFFSTKERGSTRGTGLGLSVVQGIVEKHGGLINCKSEPGKGTEFIIHLPAIVTE
ncbi:MAG: ATP-binding protein, partial [Desulfomonilaceae bacterium]